MRMKWKSVLAAVLLAALVLLGADIRYGTVTGRHCRLPVLMYHHFSQEAGSGFTVSAARFREQMSALKAAGYTAVSIAQVVDYGQGGTPLPDKPVLITMDDGYTSNLDIAAPILEDLGLCAAVFVIGINEGEAVSAHTGEALTPPRFSFEEAAPWVEKGVLDLQSHTYDMHQRPQTGGVSGREGALKKEGESAEDYRDALLEDFAQYCRRREGRVSTPLTALSYPRPQRSSLRTRASPVMSSSTLNRPRRRRVPGRPAKTVLQCSRTVTVSTAPASSSTRSVSPEQRPKG